MLEKKPVSKSIGNDALERSVCRVLSLTGTTIKVDDIRCCHQIKNREVIIEFKD